MADTNVSEEVISDMFKLYGDAINGIHDSSRRIISDMSSQVAQLKEKNAIDCCIGIVNFYNEGIKKSVKHCLDEWMANKSAPNIEGFAEQLGEAEEAKQYARAGEARIVSQVDAWSNLDTGQLEGIDKSQYNTNQKNFEACFQLFKNLMDDLESQYHNCMSKIQSEQQNNRIYVTIKAVAGTTFETVLEGFKASADEFKKMYERLKEDEQSAERRADAMAEEMIRSAGGAGSRIAEFLKTGR